MSRLRRTAVVTGLLVWLILPSSGAGGQIERMTPATATAIRSWVEAVKTHVPGHVDAPLVRVARLSYAQREELNVGMEFFLRILVGGIYDTKGNRAAKEIAEITYLAGNPDVDSFLKQAVILHSDAAEYLDNFPLPSDVTEPRPPKSRTVDMRSGPGRTAIELEDSVPPLLTASRLVLHNDGQVLNEVIASWNWPFARRLLDLLGVDKRRNGEPNRARVLDPFVSVWYHAATAYMFATGSYGDVTSHLFQGAERLPNDAWMLFDRGCYAEILGLPMHQALVPERDTGGQRTSGHNHGNSQGSPLSVRIPPAEKTNAEAERLFRRALSIDPSLVEARVRLARLLDLRKRHEEAAAELKTALAGNATPIVAFYAHLFAGRAAQSLEQSDVAAGHYQDALALFPDAQSALLASSQLALLRSNVAATLEPVQRLGTRSAVFTADPWWQYHLAAGRDADELLNVVWASVPR